MSWWLDITELDDDQKQVIGLPAEGNYVIVGPPGSGKTNLLLIRAEYLIRSGKPNVAVLMFNDPLRDFVVRGGVNYDVPADKIKKLLSWEILLLREHGIRYDDLFEDGQDLLERRRSLANRVHELLDANPRLEKQYECLLIDEVQDCVEEEINIFFRCAENVCFAGDEKQRLYHDQDVVDKLRKRADVKVVELTHHYRVGHQICRAADVVGKLAGFQGIEDSCNYKGPISSVRFVRCSDDESQATQIIDSLSAQLIAYPDELLAVAAPRKVDRDFLRSRLEASSLGPSVLPPREAGSDDPSQRIYVGNLHEIKGLEFRTLHLGLMQHLHKLGDAQKRIAFTAITRAKTSLSIYFTGKIPGYLEAAQAAIEPPKTAPDLSDLFPKKARK